MVEPIRFYTDEHVGRSIISGLRRRGVDVLTVPEADMLGATDFEHLKFATNQGRVLFTQDDDFLRLQDRPAMLYGCRRFRRWGVHAAPLSLASVGCAGDGYLAVALSAWQQRLQRLDRALVDAVPWLGRYCWETVLVLER